MISIILPTYQESGFLQKTLRLLYEADVDHLIGEVIIANFPGSEVPALPEALGATVSLVQCPKKGRADQMNYGAKKAKFPILYFLHADTQPPPGFSGEIIKAMQNNFIAGSFRLKFDLDHWFLKANCWFTRFDINAFRFGDQSLFIRKDCFRAIGGFDERLRIFEDQEIVGRIRKQGNFHIMKSSVITSARKYQENGIFKTQAVFFLIYLMYKLRFSQGAMLKIYQHLIHEQRLSRLPQEVSFLNNTNR